MGINYSKYSNMDDVSEPIIEDVEDVSIEETDETTKSDTKMGYVNCDKLYLRKKPSFDSDAVTILNRDEELMIMSDEDPEWYNVYTASGQEGFCMKDFIKLV